MATLTAEPQAYGIEPRPPGLRLFNVDEYMKIAEIGILAEPRCRHVELMDGEILVKGPDSHPGCFTEEDIAALPDPWYPSRFRFTVDDYIRIIEAGVLAEDERVELLDGEIIEMVPIGMEHEANVDDGTHFLVLEFDGRAIVRVQGSITLGDGSRPQPDLTLLKLREGGYRDRPAGPEDVLLIIEVSDSTLARDRNVKLPMYARHAIPEVWIENIPDRQIEARRNPVNGEYAESRIYRPGETISPQAFPDVQLPVSAIMGVPAETD